MSDQVNTPANLAGSTYEAAVRNKAAELKAELIKQTLDDLESWGKAVEVEYARAHPEAPRQMSPSTKEMLLGYQNRIRNEYYEWVIPAFEKYTKPDPDATNDMISGLRTIESMFQGSQDDAKNFTPASPALSRVNDVRTDMGKWEGDLQVNFIDNFLTPLQTVSINMGSVAKIVREQLECNKVVYIRYRDAVIKLLDTSIEAVKTLNNSRDPKSFMWGTLIACAVGTAAAAIPGAGWLVAGTMLNIAGTLAQGLVPDPPKKNELAAPTAQEVAVKIADAMGKLDTDTLAEENRVEQALRSIYSSLSARSQQISANTSGPLSVAVPAVSTAKPGDVTDGSLRPAE